MYLKKVSKFKSNSRTSKSILRKTRKILHKKESQWRAHKTNADGENGECEPRHCIGNKI